MRNYNNRYNGDAKYDRYNSDECYQYPIPLPMMEWRHTPFHCQASEAIIGTVTGMFSLLTAALSYGYQDKAQLFVSAGSAVTSALLLTGTIGFGCGAVPDNIDHQSLEIEMSRIGRIQLGVAAGGLSAVLFGTVPYAPISTFAAFYVPAYFVAIAFAGVAFFEIILTDAYECGATLDKGTVNNQLEVVALPKSVSGAAILTHDDGHSANFYAKACQAEMAIWKAEQAAAHRSCYTSKNIPAGTDVIGECYNGEHDGTTYYVCTKVHAHSEL